MIGASLGQLLKLKIWFKVCAASHTKVQWILLYSLSKMSLSAEMVASTRYHFMKIQEESFPLMSTRHLITTQRILDVLLLTSSVLEGIINVP